MRTTVKLFLVSFAVSVYLISTAYEISIVQSFKKVIILDGGYPNCSSILCETHLMGKTELREPSSDPDKTILNRDFFQYLVSHIRDTDYSGIENYIQFNVAQSRLKQLKNLQPLRPDYGPVLNDVTSFQYPVNIQPCKEVNVNNSFFVAIISGVDYFRKREIIRQTWIQHFLSNSVCENLLAGYGFIVGLTTNRTIQMQIEEESRKYGDILQIDMIDNYYNLTLKVVGLINWLNNYCSTAKFLLKVDDDVYVNVRNFVALTKALNPTENAIYGTKSTNNLAQRSIHNLYM